jgi:hypothetical protein
MVIGSFRNALPTVTSPVPSVSRKSDASAKRQDTAEASMTWCCHQTNTEVPMPAVIDESRAKDFCAEGQAGRGRRAKLPCSWFVLVALAMGLIGTGHVEVRGGFFLVADALPTGNSPVPSVSRKSDASAKRQDTAEASMTWCCHQFKRV